MSSWIWLIALLMLIIAAGTGAWGAWRAAPYVPTKGKDVRRMLELAAVKPGDRVYDLGAGDGRFIIAAALRGAQAVGYEIALLPYLVAWAWIKIRHLSSRAHIKYRDFFNEDLSAADVIVCFLTPRAMNKLADKFSRELQPGTRIVSYAFSIPGWTPVMKDKPQPTAMSVYLYKINNPLNT